MKTMSMMNIWLIEIISELLFDVWGVWDIIEFTKFWDTQVSLVLL